MSNIIDVRDYDGPDGHATTRTDDPCDGVDAGTPISGEVQAFLVHVVTTIAATKSPATERHEPVVRDCGRLACPEAWLRDTELNREQLRAAVKKIVRIERARGAPPEKMLVLIKGLLRRANTGNLTREEVQALTGDIVAWSIQDYYAR